VGSMIELKRLTHRGLAFYVTSFYAESLLPFEVNNHGAVLPLLRPCPLLAEVIFVFKGYDQLFHVARIRS